MARRPRLFAAGLLYHVIVRGNQRQKTFSSDEDFEAYLDRLDRYRAKCKVRIYAFCLMPNHAHLLLGLAQRRSRSSCRGYSSPIPSIIIVRIAKSGTYSRADTKRLFCDKDKYLSDIIRYIHLNPVRAGLIVRPEKYPYSGHRGYLINGTPKILEPGRVLRVLGGKKRYEKFVFDGIGESHNSEY